MALTEAQVVILYFPYDTEYDVIMVYKIQQVFTECLRVMLPCIEKSYILVMGVPLNIKIRIIFIAYTFIKRIWNRSRLELFATSHVKSPCDAK